MLTQGVERLYDFGTVDRWKKAIERAVAEQIETGIPRTILPRKDGDPTRTIAQVMSADAFQWYEVVVERDSEGLRVGCRCRAGENATPCKHIAAVLLMKKWVPAPIGVIIQPRIHASIPFDPVLDILRKDAE